MQEPQSRALSLKRLFFALWPDAALQEALYRLGETMLRPGDGRRTPLPNIHLTLAFLGSVSADAQACSENAAAKVQAEPFTLRLEMLGCFRRSGILWVGTERTPPGLSALVRVLSDGLQTCGYEPDERPFRSHLTLARRLRRCPRFPVMTPIDWVVRDFVLVESHTGPGGAQYQVLRRWPLG